MKIALVTNVAGKGLEIDADLLRSFLSGLGHEVEYVQFDQPWAGGKFDLGISLEVVAPFLFPLAPRWWWFPNLEWCKPEYLRPAQQFERIFAKTRDAERVLREKFSNVEYVGFLARDRRDLTVKREPMFLHVGGDSGFKNTSAVISAWREYRYWVDADAPLIVISKSISVSFEDTPGITFHKHLPDAELELLQNQCLFHLCPSAYEGFGHSIHESQSVGALILTTGEPPMNEFGAARVVPSVRKRKNNLGLLHDVSPADIRESVPWFLGLPNTAIAKLQAEARARFEKDNIEFRERFAPFLECPAPRVRAVLSQSEPVRMDQEARMPKLAILGNLRPQFSTENEWKEAFESLGYQVLAFQEDVDFPEDIVTACKQFDVRLLIYVHTHSFISPGKMSPDEMIVRLRALGIRTVSPHLDLYFGLNLSDQRDSKVGQHAFFKTDFVMTADGSEESAKKFNERGVNHVWLPPGVSAKACHPGKFREEFAVDVGFTGAVGYHAEHPFRAEMVHVLQEVYGDRFRVFQGHRGEQLNDVYASTKVFVGDCCFAGRPKYWSDRLPESCGRGAFLIHPQIDGMCIPTATYRPQDILDLLEKVDYYLEQVEERELIRRAAQEHVKAHDTYLHRARQILRTVRL